MPKRTNKRTQKKKQKQLILVDGNRAKHNMPLTIPRTIDAIMPDRMMTKLKYFGFTQFTIATTSTFSARRWVPSAAYDIDPTLGSTSTVGFNELALLYNNYRVISSRLRVRMAPQGSLPVQLVTVPLNADPGSSPLAATVNAWCNNPYGKVKLVGVSGAPTQTISTTMSTERIYGSKMIYFDDNFASLVNTVPNNNWYWAVAVISGVNPSSALVCTVEIDIEVHVEFYSRKVLLN